MSKKRYTRSEYGSYQPNSPLTQHYISTGAILPEKEEQPIDNANKEPTSFEETNEDEKK